MRRLTLDDAEAGAELLRALQEDVGYRPTIRPAEVRDWMQWADLEHDSWAFEEDRRLLAFGFVAEQAGVANGGGFVHPGARGRGLGSRLLELSEEWAGRRRLARLRVTVFERDDAARALLTARGYREVRRYYELERALDEAPPEPQVPAGIRIEPFEPDDARVFYDTIVEAFRDEWGFEAAPFEEWKRRRVDEGDTSLYFLARDGETPAATIRCESPSPHEGFVGAVGVRPAWRRRGLGEALLLHAFGEMHRRGLTSVRLGVDSENPTGATRLYERVGMSVASEHVVYERSLG
jgi:ribosomal protein S18 acetylase RimI-like enzyme